MSSVTHNGNTVLLKGDVPPAGDTAPDFTFVTNELKESSLYDIDANVKVILGMPSLDTGTCSKEMVQFNKELAGIDGVYSLAITMDLPFAMKRFCADNGIENVGIGSDYRYKDFASEYNAEMLDGALKGLIARVVLVVDAQNEVQYSELVPEISEEPDYSAAISAIKKLVAG